MSETQQRAAKRRYQQFRAARSSKEKHRKTTMSKSQRAKMNNREECLSKCRASRSLLRQVSWESPEAVLGALGAVLGGLGAIQNRSKIRFET